MIYICNFTAFMSKTRGFDENHFYRWPLTSIIKITMILRCIKFHRMLAYMKELWEYFKQPCSFRNRLLFSLSVLTVFQSSSVAVSGLDDNDFNIISNCSTVPPTNCPTATELIAFREQCINGFERDICPDGTTYLCGVVPDYLIETCAEDKECWPGIYKFIFLFVYIYICVRIQIYFIGSTLKSKEFPD